MREGHRSTAISDTWWEQKLAQIPKRIARSGTVLSRERCQNVENRGVDVLPLIGSPRFPPVAHVVEAVTRAASLNVLPPANGSIELRAAIAAKLSRKNGITANPEKEILVTNGAKQALHVVLTALLNSGDEVVFPTPSYVYEGTIELAGGIPRPILMSEADGYRWDVEKLGRAITARTKVLLLNNPMNPTGFVADGEDLRRITDLADRHNLVVIMDEAHEALIYDGRPHLSLGAISQAAARTVTVHSMSKGCNLMGHRIGYVVGPAVVVDCATKVLEWESLSNNFLSQAAALAVLNGPQGWIDAMVAHCQENRNRINEAIEHTEGLSVVPPNGGVGHFINISRLGMGAEETSDRLLMEYGLPTDPGPVFGEAHHIRFEGVGSPKELVDQALDRLQQACAKFRSEAQRSPIEFLQPAG